MSTRVSDEELVNCYKSSATAEEAEYYLEELLGRYQKKVITWCLHMTSSTDEASDLAQDVFLRVLKNLATFRKESRFSTWLYQIARNHCNDFLNRHRRVRFEPFDDGVISELGDEAPHLGHKLDQDEILKVFMNIVNNALTDMERKVAYMHFADGLKLPEITRLLLLTNKSGAKAYLVSAKRKLQERMARWLQSRGLNASNLI